MKGLLEDWFDHKLLVAIDDPQREHLLNLQTLGLAKCTEVEKTGCEGLSSWLFEYVNEIFLKDAGLADGGRVRCIKVEVRETDANMAMTVAEDY